MVSTGRRWIRAALAAGLLAALAVAPAAATPDTGDGHQVTICHVTSSEGNPYVVITVDVAAFDGDGSNDHTHHVANDGRTDVEYDALLGCDEPTDDPPDE